MARKATTASARVAAKPARKAPARKATTASARVAAKPARKAPVRKATTAAARVGAKPASKTQTRTISVRKAPGSKSAKSDVGKVPTNTRAPKKGDASKTKKPPSAIRKPKRRIAKAQRPSAQAAPLSAGTAIAAAPPAHSLQAELQTQLSRLWARMRKEWREGWRMLVLAIGIALVVRSCAFQPFTIPSGSMIPSLYIGDYMFVNKYRYGYSAHSFPFSLAPISGRIFARLPNRGDVVVFKLPADNRTDFVKRIIGLPGDKIEVRRGIVYINDVAVVRTPAPDFSLEQADGSGRFARQYEETLPNGVRYTVLDLQSFASGDFTLPVRVPAGQYFVMGDNRDNSVDSRFAEAVGFVPFENLVGRASMIFFSWHPDIRFWEFWQYHRLVRWERVLMPVH